MAIAAGSTAAPLRVADAAEPAKALDFPKGDPSERARVLYQRALAQYAAHDLRGARVSLERAYVIARRPELLFNLAQLDRELGACASAVHFYRAYLEQAPDGRRRVDSLRSIVELERRCPEARDEADAEQPIRAPLEHDSHAHITRSAGIVALATGAVAFTGAAVFALAMRDKQHQLEHLQARASARGPGSAPEWSSTAAALISTGRRDQTLAWTCAGVGVFASALGIFWLNRKASTSERSAAARIELELAPRAAAAYYRIAF